jgi:hypothetical protein
MAINKDELIGRWIQFLKLNQIAKSSPDSSGNLTYKRGVSVADVARFLKNNTDFDQDTINQTIFRVMSKKSASADKTKKISGTAAPKDTAEPQKQISSPASTMLPHDPMSVSDIDYREIREAFKEMNFPDLSEEDVEEIFAALVSTKPAKSSQKTAAGAKSQVASTKSSTTPAKTQSPEQKEEDIRKIKRLIRDNFTDAQRMALYRALKDANINEAQINPADAKAAFKIASQSREKPGILGKVFKGLKKEKIEFDDLAQAWTQAGRPDDTEEIAEILRDHGFSEKEIVKVFSKVFGTSKDGGYEKPTQSALVQKIADYAIAHGIAEELKDFLQKEYKLKESFAATMPDITDIFNSIIHEERYCRESRFQQKELSVLGRNRK